MMRWRRMLIRRSDENAEDKDGCSVTKTRGGVAAEHFLLLGGGIRIVCRSGRGSRKSADI
jgi:hypothetical protein